MFNLICILQWFTLIKKAWNVAVFSYISFIHPDWNSKRAASKAELEVVHKEPWPNHQWRGSHSALCLVDVEVDWQEHFLPPPEISSSCSIYLSSTSGLQMHCVLTHPVYCGKSLTVNRSLFSFSRRCHWHCSHCAHLICFCCCQR